VLWENGCVSSIEAMRCCSCGGYEASSLKLAALRQCAASSRASRHDVEDPADLAVNSAFTVYCHCTSMQHCPVPFTASHHVAPFIPRAAAAAAAAAEFVFTRWCYWSLVLHQQFVRHFTSMNNNNNNHHHHHFQRQQQKRLQRQQLLPARPVFGAPARVSKTSARYFSCSSCSYSTDRKNNLKRHVTTMHRGPAVTSSGGIHDNGEMRMRGSSSKTARTPDLCQMRLGHHAIRWKTGETHRTVVVIKANKRFLLLCPKIRVLTVISATFVSSERWKTNRD